MRRPSDFALLTKTEQVHLTRIGSHRAALRTSRYLEGQHMRSIPLVALVLAVALSTASVATAQNAFNEVDLISDIAGRAAAIDANLVNPWGIVPGPTGVFWVSNEATGTSTLYRPDGTKILLDVSIPGGSPTGIALTDSAEAAFEIPVGDTTYRALFIFVSTNGRITAWSSAPDPTTAVEVARDSAAVYTGVAIGRTNDGPRLYVANFAGGSIDVYDRLFQEIDLGAGAFVDAGLPAGYAPFNVAVIDGQVYVAYALSSGAEEVPGPGNGYVDVYDTQGVFVRRFASGGALNAPWAIVRATSGFGDFGSQVLVGNLGDGRINAFDFGTGSLLAALQDTSGVPITLPGLWGLSFGRGTATSRLYFAAGIEDETHGLFGYLEMPAPPDTTPVPPGGPCDNDAKNLAFWRNACGGPHNGHGHDDDDDDGPGHGHGRHDIENVADMFHHGHGRPPHSFPEDSLNALLACAADASPVFGPEGCFEASCDLLQQVGHRSKRERAAQQFLALELNLCAGLTCDSVVVNCHNDHNGEDDDDDFDHSGDDCGHGELPTTIGGVVTFAESLLCDPGTGRHELKRLEHLLACANRPSDDDDDDDGDGDHDGEHGDHDGGGRRDHRRINCFVAGSNPLSLSRDAAAQFEVNTTEPVMVRLRIYDAAGRYVAELLRDAPVSGRLVVRWDGIDRKGAAVAPGTYFYRATTEGASSSGRIVLMR